MDDTWQLRLRDYILIYGVFNQYNSNQNSYSGFLKIDIGHDFSYISNSVFPFEISISLSRDNFYNCVKMLISGMTPQLEFEISVSDDLLFEEVLKGGNYDDDEGALIRCEMLLLKWALNA